MQGYPFPPCNLPNSFMLISSHYWLLPGFSTSPLEPRGYTIDLVKHSPLWYLVACNVTQNKGQIPYTTYRSQQGACSLPTSRPPGPTALASDSTTAPLTHWLLVTYANSVSGPLHWLFSLLECSSSRWLDVQSSTS